jgi:hypothetical protein
MTGISSIVKCRFLQSARSGQSRQVACVEHARNDHAQCGNPRNRAESAQRLTAANYALLYVWKVHPRCRFVRWVPTCRPITDSQKAIAVLSFSSKSRRLKEAQGCLMKIINNNCPQLEALSQGERDEQRLNLTVVTYVVPIRDGGLDIAAAKATVTKEFSSAGLSVILDDALDTEEVLLALPWDGETTYFRGDVKHQSPIGAGLWQCGVQVTEIVPSGEYPELATLEF